MSMLKKIFIGSVMMMTVLSMSVVVAPTAKAAAAAGDLIKTSTSSSVYYLGTNMKKYVFPNAATYFSWYKDFSGVVTIPQSEMDSYGLPVGNVTVRPGTKLVKSPSVNTVYAVEPGGTLRSIVSEANAINLWGANWATKVIDLPDSFIVNYVPGLPLSVGQYPVGQLIKTSGSSDVMLVAADGTARKFASEAAFNANNYSFDYVETVPSTYTMPAAGAVVSGNETGLSDVSQGGAVVGPVVTGSGVSIALSSDSPASQSIPAGVSRIELAKFNVTASNDGAAVINSIKITRTGLGKNTDFPLIWIEKAGVRLTGQKSINSSDEAILTFAPALSVAAGQTVILSVIGSVNATYANLGSADALTIKAAADVDASGASVSGSFPISGNSMTFASYTMNTATFAAVSGVATYTVGDEDVVIGSFSVADSGSPTRDLTFKSIMLKNTGNADLAAALGDLRLEKNGVKVSDTTTISGKNVTFTLANGGLLIDKGETVTFKIVGSVIYQDASNNNVTLKLNKAEDMNIIEANSGYAATIAGEGVSLGATTLAAGDITISKAASSPSAQSVTKSTKGITALIANIKANEAFTADGMVITLVVPTTTVASFENIKLYVNNALVDSLNADASGEAVTYSSSVAINQGNNEVKVLLDTTSTAANGDSITVKLNGAAAFDTPVFANDESATSKIGGSATAAVITVATASDTVTRSDGFSNNKLIVKGTVGAVLGKFTVKALNDTIKITSVVLGANTGSVSQIKASDLSDLQLFVDGSQIGATKNYATTTGVTFGSLALSITKDTTKVIEIRGSLSSSATADTYFKAGVVMSGEDSNGKAVADSTSVDTTQFKVADSGTLTIAKDGDSPVAAIVAAMTTGNSFGKWKLTATNDDISLGKVYISNLKGTGSDPRISNVNLYNGATLVGSAAVTNGEVYFNLNSSVTITKGTSIILEAKADLNQIEEAAQTNKDVQLAITKVTANSSAGIELSGSNNAVVNFAATGRTLEAAALITASSLTVSDSTGIATGTVIKIDNEEMLVTGASASSTTVTRGINGTAAAAHVINSAITKITPVSVDSFRIRKTYPIITLDTLPSSVLTAGDNVVAKIKVSAQANADVTLSSIVLTANATVANVLVASSTALNSVRINGSTYSAATVAPNDDNNTGDAMSSILVTFTTPVTVAAGTTKTIEVIVNVTSLSSVNNNFTTKIVSDAAYSWQGTFKWSDNANPIDPTATYAGSYKILGIPTVSQVLSQN